MQPYETRQVGIGHNRGPVWLPMSSAPEDAWAVYPTAHALRHDVRQSTNPGVATHVRAADGTIRRAPHGLDSRGRSNGAG